MGKKSRQKARVAVYSRNVVSPWGLLLQSCAVQVQSTMFPTPSCAVVSCSLNVRHKHVMPSQRGSARRRRVVVAKLWGWCWAGQFQLPTCCVCHMPGHGRDCLRSRRCVPETILHSSAPPCELSSGVTADKPQPAGVV